ncbi:hypothetical protein ACSSS7_006365 [Eimeria intestinalis]
MANKKWSKATRQVPIGKKNRTALLPYSIQKELEARQGPTKGYHQAGSDPYAFVTGTDSDEPTWQSPQQRQISRKELRKKRRVQQRQQKHEHQLMRKKQRVGLAAEAFLPAREGQLSNKRSKRLMNRQAPEEGMTVGFSTKEREELSNPLASGSEECGRPADDGSIGAAAATLKTQQQKQGVAPLHEDLRLLERRLCKHTGGTQDTEETRSRRMQKLRQELNEDGFDFELQGVLDDILSSRDQPSRACSTGREKIDARSPLETAGHDSERLQAKGRAGAGCRNKADGESVGNAANVLKRQQQQHSGTDGLQDAFRLLEKRLLAHGGERKGGETSATDRRKKLREELEKDGFDLELQDILDDILVCFAHTSQSVQHSLIYLREITVEPQGGGSRDNQQLHPLGCSVCAQGTGAGCESGVDASDDEVTRIEAMSAFKGHEAQDEDESRPQPKTYVAPHRRHEAGEADAATANGLTVEAVKVEVVRALNRISEGNAEPVFHHLLRVLQRNSAKLQSHHSGEKQSSDEVHAYTVGVRHLVCEQLMQSCIKSRFSTNSLIATQTALCCALSKTWDMELCREFLGSLAVCFSTYFAKSLSLRTQQPEAVVADTASLVTRHSVVGLCCLYDFGFISPRLFVELIRRVAGLRDTKASEESKISLSDYRVELLLLLLRLGGGKLRQDDAKLFTSTWKQLQGLVQTHDGRAEPRADVGASHAADELPAEAGRLRALILELQDLKAGKQKDSLMLVKASQDAMRRWLSSNSVFGPTLLTAQYQIDGSWDALEQEDELEGLRLNMLVSQYFCSQVPLLRMQVTQVVAVTMQCCMQEKMYNEFYGMVLSRLCGVCGCRALSAGEEATCLCFFLPDKAAARYRRTVQRGLAAQVSAAHGFSLRRLLNLAKLTAFQIRLGITDLRIVRFLNFEGSVEGRSSLGLTGKLGIFLREVCIELLSTAAPRASSPSVEHGAKEVAAGYFSCLHSMSDICEVFIALLQDVVLPSAQPDGRSSKRTHTVESTEAGKTLKASIVEAALNALLSHQRPEP